MDLYEVRPVVFTAQSKLFFYCRDAVCEFVLKRGCVPIHPFQAFGYFLADKVDRDLVRRGNFNLLRGSDELWVFGHSIANGVEAEILYAHRLGKPIRFFSISPCANEIRELEATAVTLEAEPGSELRDLARQRATLAAILGQRDPRHAWSQ